MADIGLAAFSVFFMQSPSFLAHQRRLQEGHGRSNGESLFGLTRIPSDNHIRTIVDPAEPNLLHPVYAAVLHELEQSGGLGDFRRLGDHVLIALDGTQYFCSGKLHCAHCSTRLRSNGRTEYFHAMLGATLVAPGHSHVVPLEPEPRVQPWVQPKGMVHRPAGRACRSNVAATGDPPVPLDVPDLPFVGRSPANPGLRQTSLKTALSRSPLRPHRTNLHHPPKSPTITKSTSMVLSGSPLTSVLESLDRTNHPAHPEDTGPP